MGEDYQKMVQMGMAGEGGSYKDRYRSGWHTGVKEKCSMQLQAKNEEIRVYRNFYKNNKIQIAKGIGCGSSSAGKGASNPGRTKKRAAG